MKKVVLVLAMVALTFSMNAQGKYSITKDFDDMTGKTSYLSDVLVLANDAKTKGFKIQPYFKVYKGKVEWLEWIITSVNIGSSCVEKSGLIILFEDGSKYELNAWNKFNCDGTSFMSMRSGLIEAMKTSKPEKIRFTNGRDHNSYTAVLSKDEKMFFQDILNSLEEINE